MPMTNRCVTLDDRSLIFKDMSVLLYFEAVLLCVCSELVVSRGDLKLITIAANIAHSNYNLLFNRAPLDKKNRFNCQFQLFFFKSLMCMGRNLVNKMT